MRILRGQLGELAVSAALAVAGGYLYLSTLSIRGAEQGTRHFPQVYALTIAAGGLLAVVAVLIRGWRQRPGAAEPAAAGIATAGTATATAEPVLAEPTPAEPGLAGPSPAGPSPAGLSPAEPALAEQEPGVARPAAPRWLGLLDRTPLPTQLIIVVVAYVAVLDRLGYLVSTTAFGIVMMWLLTRRRSLSLLLFPLLMTLTLYAIFSFGLSVDLP